MSFDLFNFLTVAVADAYLVILLILSLIIIGGLLYFLGALLWETMSTRDSGYRTF